MVELLQFKNCCSDTFLLGKVQHPVFQTNLIGLIIAVWMYLIQVHPPSHVTIHAFLYICIIQNTQ